MGQIEEVSNLYKKYVEKRKLKLIRELRISLNPENKASSSPLDGAIFFSKKAIQRDLPVKSYGKNTFKNTTNNLIKELKNYLEEKVGDKKVFIKNIEGGIEESSISGNIKDSEDYYLFKTFDGEPLTAFWIKLEFEVF